MSINFTSDIDGAASGNGITKITVGGKTIDLTEEASGGGNFQSGSFTPTENMASYTITFDSPVENVVCMNNEWHEEYGVRNTAAFISIKGFSTWQLSTNASGSSISALGLNNANVVFADDGLSVKLTAYDYLVPVKYDWLAW